MEDKNFVFDNAKFKRPEVSDSKDRTAFSAGGKILFVDMETLPSIADTTFLSLFTTIILTTRDHV